MPEQTPEPSTTTIKRRKFFGSTLSGIAGGLAFGNILGLFSGAKRHAGRNETGVRITPNPDSVPRTSKGVK
jgi:hypothetical protein